MRVGAWCFAAALALATAAGASGFGVKAGAEPSNIEEIAGILRGDAHDLELLISFGTSKGGSAGHLALAIRDDGPDESVYSANFYADRDPGHEAHHYTRELMVRIPKTEYLFRTASTIDEKASFGLDFGEIYKRSVIGVRVFGVPAREKEALAAFFRRLNDDYRNRARDTEYHDGEVRYDYIRLNCAKTIGAAFRHGAGYEDVDVDSAKLLPRVRLVAAVNANIPTEMAMKLLKAWDTRGYRLDVVLYRKFAGSAFVDPLEEEKVAFKDLPDRFPSVLSRDFRREQGQYEDYDNLHAMYLLTGLARYRVGVDGATRRLEIQRDKPPLTYSEAAALAAQDARFDSAGFLGRKPFRRKGTPVEVVPGQPVR